jgi:hypothetical protein
MVRTIITPDRPSISFDIPEQYVGKQIEVIAFEKEEGFEIKTPVKKKVTFEALPIDTRGYKFDRDEANE